MYESTTGTLQTDMVITVIDFFYNITNYMNTLLVHFLLPGIFFFYISFFYVYTLTIIFFYSIKSLLFYIAVLLLTLL